MTIVQPKRQNIQIIDSALNCTYEVFSVSPEDFGFLFPAAGQDVEFVEDFFAREGDRAPSIWARLWSSRVDKKILQGIHGTIFCGLEGKKRFYPTKKESEMLVGLGDR